MEKKQKKQYFVGIYPSVSLSGMYVWLLCMYFYRCVLFVSCGDRSGIICRIIVRAADDIRIVRAFSDLQKKASGVA